MIEIIPLKKEDLFIDGFSKKEIKKLSVSNYCYSVDMDLLTKLLSIKNRPIKSQKLFIRNILDFLNYIDGVFITEGKDSISSKIFEEYFTCHNYNKYKDILSDLEIITKVPYEDGSWYEKGKYSMKYVVHNKYLKLDNLCLVIIGEGRKKYDRPFIVDDRLDLDERYINTIEKVDINIINAIEAEIDHCSQNDLPLNILRNRINRLFYLRQKRFIKKGNKVDRIYHSFTNLTKVSRKHLITRFNYIDLKNSQPLILVYYLMDNKLCMDNNYKIDCEDGTFYENFYDIYKIKSEEELRTKVKQQVYKNLFFGFDERSLVNKRFKEIYPMVWKSLLSISKEDISLASRLQNIESELFNNLRPENSKEYFTLFDAIYFSDSMDISDMSNKIMEFFRNLGVEVKIEIG